MSIELAAAYISILPSTEKLESGIKTALNRAERDLKIAPTVDTTRMHSGFTQAGRAGSESFLGAFKTYTQQGMSPVGTALGLTVGRTIGAGIRANQAMFHAAGQMIANTLKGALIGGVAGVGALVTTTLFKGFQRLESLDRARHQLEALGKSAEEVKQIMADVNDVVTGTPIALNEAMAEVPKLLAANVKDIKGFITAVGDAAGFTGDSFESIAEGFNQVLNQGKLTMEEVQNQFRNLPVVNWLAKSMGTDPASISKMISDGKIGIQQLMDAVESNAGGFAKKMGDTIEGAMQNTMVAIARLGANVISAAFGGDAVNASDNIVDALKQISAKFDDLSNWVTAHRDQIHQFFTSMADFARQAGQALGGITSWLLEHPNVVKTALAIWAGAEVLTAISSIAKLATGAKDLATGMAAVKAVGISGLAAEIGTMGTASAAAAPGLWAMYGPLAAIAAILGAGFIAGRGFAQLPAQARAEAEQHAREYQNQMQEYFPFQPWPGMEQGAPPPANWPGMPAPTQWPHQGQQTPGTAPPGTPGIGSPSTPTPGEPGFVGPIPVNPKPGGGQSNVAAGNPQQAVHAAMLQSGFPESEWPALNTLIQGESGWRTTVRNPSSGAYGLFQFLGHESDKYGALGAYNADPASQAIAGLAYIRDRYGSPSAALAFWQSQSPHWYGRGGAVDSVPALLTPGEHVFDTGDVAAMGGQRAVYRFREALHMQEGGAVGELSPEILAKANELGIPPEAVTQALLTGITGGGGIGGQINAIPAKQGEEPVQADLTSSGRTAGFIPAGVSNTGGVPGTSSISKWLGVANEFVGFLIDTGAEVGQAAISAAITAGIGAGASAGGPGAGAAAAIGPAASQAAGFGIKIAASELKRLSSYGFQMAGIGIDALVENIFSPFGGAPRWMGYDYTAFVPSIATQAAQYGITTGEKAIEEAINAGINQATGKPAAQAGGPVSPEHMAGMSAPAQAPQPRVGQPPSPPRTPSPEGLHLGTGKAPGPDVPGGAGIAQPFAPQNPQTAAGAQSIQPQNDDWLSNLIGGMTGGQFDRGGWLQPGQPAINLTKRPEPVLTGAQWDALSSAAAAPSNYAVKIDNIYAMDAEDVSRQIENRQRLAMMRYSGRP